MYIIRRMLVFINSAHTGGDTRQVRLLQATGGVRAANPQTLRISRPLSSHSGAPALIVWSSHRMREHLPLVIHALHYYNLLPLADEYVKLIFFYFPLDNSQQKRMKYIYEE